MNRLVKVCFALIALAFLVGLMAAASSAETKGRLQAVFPDRNELILETDQGKALAFKFDEFGKVFINNREANLADLMPGEEVSIVFEFQLEQRVAREVRCIRFEELQLK